MSKLKTDWQKIYLDHSPKLLGICRRYIADLPTAEDIVQDSFITAMQKNHQLKDEKAVFGWLKKIVVNNALQVIRKTTKDTFITTETSEIPDIYTEMNTAAFDEKKNILAYDFTQEELLKSIDNLAPHHKSVFNLYYIENYTHAEISGILEIPVNTSKSHLMRAKKSVQNYLLTHFVNKESSKNKTAQLLIFLGFGGLLWAQTFQSKFSDFTVSPSQNFEIPSDIMVNNITFSSAHHHWKQKAIIACAFFIIIVGSIFFFNPKKNWGAINHSDSQNLNLTKKIADNHQSNIKNKNAVKKSLESNQTEEKSDKKFSIDLSKEKQPNKTKNLVSSKIINKKDSAKTTAHKVIVVKKIIQRDTIYIER